MAIPKKSMGVVLKFPTPKGFRKRKPERLLSEATVEELVQALKVARATRTREKANTRQRRMAR